jgi:hypothetical protein
MHVMSDRDPLKSSNVLYDFQEVGNSLVLGIVILYFLLPLLKGVRIHALSSSVGFVFPHISAL